MALRQYDPKEISVIFAGLTLGGWADGEFVNHDFDENLFNMESGADGIVSRSKINNNISTLTITLSQTSPSNDALSGFVLADRASNTGVQALTIKDNGGLTKLFSPTAWINKDAPIVYSKEIATRVWEFTMTDVIAFVGGNSDVIAVP